MSKIPYVSLGQQAEPLMTELLEKARAVISSGHYVLGPEVTKFEEAFAKYCGTEYAVGVSNGTSAISLVLGSLGLKSHDEVITVPNSFISSASAIVLAGGKPVFVDVGDDLNMDPAKIEAAITDRTKAIMPVHLCGRVARMEEIQEIANRHDLPVIEDAAQAVGAARKGKRAGSWGYAGTFSLHPLKNLHAFGDAGVVTTNSESLYNHLKQARNHGFVDRDHCQFWSPNERLDEIQAAFLNVQLPHLDDWTATRRDMAKFYNDNLRSLVKVPEESPDEFLAHQTYMIRTSKRDALQAFMIDQGVDVKVHYPIPICHQEAAAAVIGPDDKFPKVEELRTQILSLPLYPGLAKSDQERVVSAVRKFFDGEGAS